jgi:hypothetical protein
METGYDTTRAPAESNVSAIVCGLHFAPRERRDLSDVVRSSPQSGEMFYR